MKRSYTAVVAVFMLLSLSSIAQDAPVNQHPVEKTALFSQLPEKFYCPVTVLQQLFSNNVNAKFSTRLGNELQLDGTVLEKKAITAQQLSINIRCTNFQDALLNISQVVSEDGTTKYIGRIISPYHGDVLLLWQDKGDYYFIKQKQLLTMVE